MLEFEFNSLMKHCQYLCQYRDGSGRAPRHSRASVVLDDRSNVIVELDETDLPEDTRIVRFHKCRGFRKNPPKEIKFKYDKATGLCTTVAIKGVHAEYAKAVRLKLKLSQDKIA